MRKIRKILCRLGLHPHAAPLAQLTHDAGRPYFDTPEDTMTDTSKAPDTPNADDWLLWLKEFEPSPEFLAVRIVEAMERHSIRHAAKVMNTRANPDLTAAADEFAYAVRKIEAAIANDVGHGYPGCAALQAALAKYNAVKEGK